SWSLDEDSNFGFINELVQLQQTIVEPPMHKPSEFRDKWYSDDHVTVPWPSMLLTLGQHRSMKSRSSTPASLDEACSRPNNSNKWYSDDHVTVPWPSMLLTLGQHRSMKRRSSAPACLDEACSRAYNCENLQPSCTNCSISFARLPAQRL